MELVEVPSSRSLRDRVGGSQEKKAKFYGARILAKEIYIIYIYIIYISVDLLSGWHGSMGFEHADMFCLVFVQATSNEKWLRLMIWRSSRRIFLFLKNLPCISDS